MKNIGERIYKNRERCGLSQLEFSELLDVSRQAVSKWETGTAMPELAKLIKMSEIFGISLDELILGKEISDASTSAEKIKEDPVTENKSQSKIRSDEKSLIKIIMGCFFLIAGTILSVFFMFWSPLFGMFLILPFGLCAFFCLKQFKHAGLWCSETWFVAAVVYLCYGTGTDWDLVFNLSLYSPHTNIYVIIFSWIEFILLVFFIFMTVRTFRNHRFDYSKRRHIAYAAACGATGIMSFMSDRLFSFVCLHLICNGDKIQYYHFLTNMDNFPPVISSALELSFIAVFTACLIPTVYWIKNAIKSKRAE